MTTLAETMSGTGPEINYKGRKLITSAWGIADFSAARAHLRATLRDPMQGLADAMTGLPEAVQREIAMKAYEDRKQLGDLDTPEAKLYFTSKQGMAFWLWRALLPADGELTFEEIAEWLCHPKSPVTNLQLQEWIMDLQDVIGMSERAVKALEGNSQRLTSRQRQPQKRKR